MRPKTAFRAALALSLLFSVGCGHMRLQGGEVETVEEWPLAQRIDVGVLPDGGLRFSSVTYQYGTDRFSMDTDCTLDMALIQGERNLYWYSYAAAMTLSAVPVIFDEIWTVKCTLRDRDHNVLAELKRQDTITDVLWLPFLAFNILFNIVDLGGLGTTSGLNSNGVNAKAKAVQERMFRSIMVEVRDLIQPKDPPQAEEPTPDDEPSPNDEAPPGGG